MAISKFAKVDGRRRRKLLDATCTQLLRGERGQGYSGSSRCV